MKKRIRIWICLCLGMSFFFSSSFIVQATDKKDTAKTYYAYLKDLEKKEKKWNNEATTTFDMNNASREIYNMWDDELNSIYKKLKSKLSENEFKKLQRKQRKWIMDKETEVEKVRQEWLGGTGETFATLAEAASITKKRVYELAEQLYGKNPDSEVQEKSTIKTKVLSQNKVYSYDLDKDGKKEKIKYIIKKNDNSLQEKIEVILYINEKERYRKKVEYALNAQYTIADIDKMDGYLDLFLIVTSDSYCLEYAAFQQYQSNQIKTLTSSLNNKSIQSIRGYDIEGVDGKGNFKAAIDTPFALKAIGNYYCYIPFVMEKGNIKQKKVSTYSLAAPSKDFKYILKKAIKVYEKATTSSKIVRTIKKGESITISKIKLSTSSDNLKENVPISGYAYIKDKNGKKGWIYLDKKYNWNNPLFKETPGWG